LKLAGFGKLVATVVAKEGSIFAASLMNFFITAPGGFASRRKFLSAIGAKTDGRIGFSVIHISAVFFLAFHILNSTEEFINRYDYYSKAAALDLGSVCNLWRSYDLHHSIID